MQHGFLKPDRFDSSLNQLLIQEAQPQGVLMRELTLEEIEIIVGGNPIIIG
ncbi:hypothetical protein N9W89_11460 [Hellea sp.]|nr:hypothetical protein [Hellea sp.]